MANSLEQERLVTNYSGRLFLTISFGWLLCQMGRGLLPPLLPNIIDDLAITSTKAGFAVTLMWGIYALGQFPSGRLSDLLSRKTLLVVGLGFLAIGFFTISGTISYPMLLGGASIIGVGAGLYPSAARALVSDLFVERRGQAFGLHTASGDLGNATAAGLAVAAVAVATWQKAFLPLVVLSCGTLLAVHLWNRERYVFKTAPLKIRSTFWRFFEDAHLRRLLISYSLFAFTWQSTAGFLPTFLQFEKGFSVGLASTAFAFVFIIGTLIKPVSGYVGDTFGRVKIGIGSLLLGMSGIVCVLMFESTLLIFIGIGIFAFGLMAYPPVMQAFVMDVFPDESMGGDLGAMRTMYIGIGSLGPTYVGYVASVRTYSIAFSGLVLCLLASAVILLTTTLGSAKSEVGASPTVGPSAPM